VTLEASFAESFLRNPPVRLLSLTHLATRGAALLAVSRDLRIGELYGPGLAKMGATAEVSSGPYDLSRAWARALWEHPDRPDGIAYSSRHDDSARCVALFDRASDALSVLSTAPLTDDGVRLARLLRRYDVGLTP